ncbi:hypothetical protein ACIBTV_25480 [Micromonospora sp. NPDC049366]|uniref:hypothetical protein n=1 Tax=Micromonospora sp. NPDC049366 TaxID=3364271 RepID=UPI00378FF3E3
MPKRIHLPGTVTLLRPGDPLYPLSKQRAAAGVHALHVGDPTGRGGTIVGTLDELAVHVGEAASVIFTARAAGRGDDAPPDDRAIVIDREQLAEWTAGWTVGTFGRRGIVSVGDVVVLMMDLDAVEPKHTGWAQHADIKRVDATATDDDEVIFSVDVAAGFRLCTEPQPIGDLCDDDLEGPALSMQVAERVAALLNEQWAAYRAAR